MVKISISSFENKIIRIHREPLFVTNGRHSSTVMIRTRAKLAKNIFLTSCSLDLAMAVEHNVVIVKENPVRNTKYTSRILTKKAKAFLSLKFGKSYAMTLTTSMAAVFINRPRPNSNPWVAKRPHPLKASDVNYRNST